MAAVDFRVLGPVGVIVDGEPQRLRPMERTVLAVLLAEPNRPVSMDALVDRVWRGEPPRTASTAIRVHIDRLRAAMRRQDVSRLVSAGGGYRLVVEPAELDSLRFENDLRRGRETAQRDPASAADVLRSGLDEWRGTPFDSIEGIESITMTRSYLERRREELLVELADVELAAGRHTGLVADLRRWCAEFPGAEPLAASLVIALYRSGDQVAALDECRAFIDRFSDEYGLDAGRQFRRLEADVLNQARSLDPPAQLEPATDPAPIGRQDLVDAVIRVLTGAHPPRLVALAGPPGGGVSTVLAHLADTLPGALVLGPGAGGVAAIASQLGLALAGGTATDHAAVLAAGLRRRGQLVIIDDVDDLSPDSLEFLLALIRFPGIAPLVTGGRGHPLAGHPLLSDGWLAPSDCVGFEVPPLPEYAARAVAESLISGRHPDRDALVARVVESAGGDPFLLSALAREADVSGEWSGAPASLAEFVRRRLANLSPAAANLLILAAVDQPDVLDLPMLASALGLSLDEAAELAERGLAESLLVESGSGLTFRHAGFREVLAAERLDPALHLGLFRSLAGAQPPDLGRIAQHARLAPGLDAEAAEYTAREAGQLLGSGAPLAAADRFGQAADLAGRARLAPALGLGWQLEQAHAMSLGGRLEQAMVQAAQVAADARRADEPVLFAEAALASVSPWTPLGSDARRAQLLISEALDLVPAQAGALRVRLVEGYLRAGQAGDPTMLARLGDVEPELVRQADGDEPATALDALRALHSLTWPRRQPAQRRLELAQRMVVASARIGRTQAELEALRLVVGAHIELADRLAAANAAQHYAHRAEEAGSVLHQWWAARRSEMLAGLAGRPAIAQRHALRAATLQAGVDPETVQVALHEKQLSDAVRDGALAEQAEAMAGLDDDMSDADPLYQLAGAAIAAAAGAAVPQDYLAQLWNGVRGTFRGGAGAGLIVLSLDAAPSEELADELAAELGVFSGCWIPIGGSAGIGPADAHLARLFAIRGDVAAAARHRRLAISVAHRFAPDWVRFVEKE